MVIGSVINRWDARSKFAFIINGVNTFKNVVVGIKSFVCTTYMLLKQNKDSQMSGKLNMSSVKSLETAFMSPVVFHSKTVTNSFKQILNFRLYYASVESSLFF